MLFEHEQRLLEIRSTLLQFLLEQPDLGVLAAQAENCGAGDVRVVDVAGEEPAEGSGVFAGAAATEPVVEELETVYVFEGAPVRRCLAGGGDG